MPLTDKKIIVTRAAQQADRLCRQLTAAGAVPVRFPTLQIVTLKNLRPAREKIARLTAGDYQLAIFISANAVEHALRLTGRPPPDLRLAVIGKASARALVESRYQLRADLQPAHGFDSEALLALPELQRVKGWQILIFRGQGGRGLLADTLRARGATVDYAEVYRRIVPPSDPRPLLALWRQQQVFAATATSNQALQNLVDLCGPAASVALRQTRLAVASQRARDLALSLGWQAPIAVAEDAGEEALLQALKSLASEP